jgi:hypothetical protein
MSTPTIGHDTVRYFGGAKAAAGTGSERVALPPGASVEDLLATLTATHGVALQGSGRHDRSPAREVRPRGHRPRSGRHGRPGNRAGRACRRRPGTDHRTQECRGDRRAARHRSGRRSSRKRPRSGTDARRRPTREPAHRRVPIRPRRHRCRNEGPFTASYIHSIERCCDDQLNPPSTPRSATATGSPRPERWRPSARSAIAMTASIPGSPPTRGLTLVTTGPAGAFALTCRPRAAVTPCPLAGWAVTS